MTPSPRTSLWERWADFTVRFSRPILIIVFLGTIFFGYFVTRLEMNTQVRDFHRKDSYALVKTIEEDFKEGQYLTLIVESQSDRKSLLLPGLLQQQFRILEEIKRRYKVKVYSLVEGINESLERTQGKSILDIHDYSTIASGIVALAGPKTVIDLEKVSRHLLSHPEAIGFYEKFRIAAKVMSPFSAGAELEFSVPFVKAIRHYLQFDPGYTPKEQTQIAASIRQLARSLETSDIRTYLAGESIASYDADFHARQNAVLMALLLIAVDSLILWMIFRNKWEVFLVLGITLTAGVWTFGLAGLLGVPLSFLHLITIPILLGVGIDDDVILGCRFSEELKKGKRLPEALRTTFVTTGKGVFLTTFTTFTAFLISALTNSSRAVISFNLLVSLSMVFCFLLTVLLQGALRSELAMRGVVLGRRSAPADDATERFLTRFWRSTSEWINRRPRLILLGGGLIFLVALSLIRGIESEFEGRSLMKRTMPSYHADEVEKKYFGRTLVGYVLLEGNVENPLLLQKMKKLSDQLRKYPEMEKILGIADIDSVLSLIEKMNIPIRPDVSVKEILDRITTSDETANYVLDETYREAAAHLVRKRKDHYNGFLMEFNVEGQDALTIRAVSQRIQEEIRRINFNEISGVKVRVGGGGFGAHVEGGYYFRNLIWSFFVTLVVDFLVILFVLKRIRQSLLSIIPIIFSVALTLALMRLFGVKLGPLNLTVGSIIVGLGDDYPIHLIERFEEERRREGVGRSGAIQRALSSLGFPIFGCSLTTMIGFAASAILAMPIAADFGILTAVAILLVLLGSFVLLPSFLVVGEFKERLTGGP